MSPVPQHQPSASIFPPCLPPQPSSQANNPSHRAFSRGLLRSREHNVQPPGDPKTLWRATLETGASLLQSTDPLSGFNIYVAGLHCAKHEPHMQMEGHHYCKQVNFDFLQCVLFDGNTSRANLIGIEYIISEKLFGGLPE